MIRKLGPWYVMCYLNLDSQKLKLTCFILTRTLLC